MASHLTALYIIPIAFAFAFGACIGSFLNVVIYRVPKDESVSEGFSHCPACGHRLHSKDLVPIFSYLLLGRRCAYCAAPISPRYMLGELAAGGLAVLCWCAYLPPTAFLYAGGANAVAGIVGGAANGIGGIVGGMANGIGDGIAADAAAAAPSVWDSAAPLLLAFPGLDGARPFLSAAICFAALCVLLAIAWIDADTMEIYDSMNIALAVCAAAATLIGADASLSLKAHLIGIVCVAGPLLLFSLVVPGAFGMGDVLLMAAAGLMLGWRGAFVALFIGIIIGGAYGIWLLATKRKGREQHFAFGPALCVGIGVSMFFGQRVLDWYLGFI